MSRLTPEEVEKRIRLLRTPVDYEGLIEAGVLARERAWYRILDPERVPEHLWVQIGGAMFDGEGSLLFRFPGRSQGVGG